MWSQSEGGLSAITQVKVLSPEIVNIALGQGVHEPEASTATCAGGECVRGVPGSESMAGNLFVLRSTMENGTVHIGTWESHIVPTGSFQQAEEARRKYGDMAVGLTHIVCWAADRSGGLKSLWRSDEGRHIQKRE